MRLTLNIHDDATGEVIFRAENLYSVPHPTIPNLVTAVQVIGHMLQSKDALELTHSLRTSLGEKP